MRIARYAKDDSIHYGVVELEADGGSYPDTVSELEGDPFAGPVHLAGPRHSLADVRLLAPVLPRSKVIGIAKNSVPGQADPPAPTEPPVIFLKPNTSVIGPDEAIQLPTLSSDTVLEAELAVVIGRICRAVPIERVPEVIFGYTVTNDVTARDLIQPGNPWGLAKAWDTFTPLGPWIVTHLSLEEASNLGVEAKVDEHLVTQGRTKGLIHPIAELVSFASSVMTLLPGDVILTAAPGGGAPIRAGQTVSIEVEEIGVLTNPVIGEV
ncbi:MAG: fumarylacetoacetate hydrolase family protein [Propionibacteriaceae bacterium]|jgi:2-keto-4-pentenoate hydratase/2-oxohepta-3-ene-1,7-dioic acid hydratase in catechol pathway|nr:fumarylacetoacetate hydrolase family protein [Propionibacteriaceae bacterium]